MTIGEKVKQLREKAGMSQTAVANELGVSLRTVQNYEADRGFPKTTDIVFKMCKLFEVSTDYLMTEKEEFILEAQNKNGRNGKREAQELVTELSGLFAGGSLKEEDMDKVFKALTDVYWDAKESNKKYAPNKKK